MKLFRICIVLKKSLILKYWEDAVEQMVILLTDWLRYIHS